MPRLDVLSKNKYECLVGKFICDSRQHVVIEVREHDSREAADVVEVYLDSMRSRGSCCCEVRRARELMRQEAWLN